MTVGIVLALALALAPPQAEYRNLVNTYCVTCCKGTGTTLPNFSLVQVVGCLAPGPNDVWLLTNTSEPIVTKDQPSTPDELKLAESRPPGRETYRLVSTSKFTSAFQRGQKIEAKGLIYREPNDSRLNLTSLKPLGSTCAK